MTSNKLTTQEKELAYQLWEMSSNSNFSSNDRVSAFKAAPQKVCDAIDDATQQPHRRDDARKNPFRH